MRMRMKARINFRSSIIIHTYTQMSYKMGKCESMTLSVLMPSLSLHFFSLVQYYTLDFSKSSFSTLTNMLEYAMFVFIVKISQNFQCRKKEKKNVESLKNWRKIQIFNRLLLHTSSNVIHSIKASSIINFRLYNIYWNEWNRILRCIFFHEILCFLVCYCKRKNFPLKIWCAEES